MLITKHVYAGIISVQVHAQTIHLFKVVYNLQIITSAMHHITFTHLLEVLGLFIIFVSYQYSYMI